MAHIAVNNPHFHEHQRIRHLTATLQKLNIEPTQEYQDARVAADHIDEVCAALREDLETQRTALTDAIAETNTAKARKAAERIAVLKIATDETTDPDLNQRHVTTETAAGQAAIDIARPDVIATFNDAAATFTRHYEDTFNGGRIDVTALLSSDRERLNSWAAMQDAANTMATSADWLDNVDQVNARRGIKGRVRVPHRYARNLAYAIDNGHADWMDDHALKAVAPWLSLLHATPRPDATVELRFDDNAETADEAAFSNMLQYYQRNLTGHSNVASFAPSWWTGNPDRAHVANFNAPPRGPIGGASARMFA